jgi:hypothetical protein
MPVPQTTIQFIYVASITALAVSGLLSFYFMLKNRDPISTFFWVINPFNWVLGWWSYDLFDFNPGWLRVFRFVAVSAFVCSFVYKLTHAS